MMAALGQISSFVGEPQGPAVTAESAIVVHAESGRILWGKNIHRTMYPASTTKLLTALILLEETSPTDIIQAPEDIKEVKGSSLHLEPKERISAHDALYALMIRSANDVAHSVAVKLSGSEEKFAEKMHDYSQKIGMHNSRWATPHGLNNPWHKTTAYDLAQLGREAAKYPELIEAGCTEKFTVTRDINQKDTLLVSRNKLLKLDDSNLGLKTGYTNPAGYCFVGLNETKFGRVVTVVLNSSDWAGDQLKMVTWIKSKFGVVDTIARDTTVEVFLPNVKEGQTLKAKVARPLRALVSEHDLSLVNIKLDDQKRVAPITAGTAIGRATVQIGDKEYPVDLVAVNSVEAKPTLEDFLKNPLAIVFVLLASTGYWLRKRSYERLQS